MREKRNNDLNVLLVSTDEQRIKHVYHELEPAFQVDIAECMESALVLLDSGNYDSIIVDVDDRNLPNLDLLEDFSAHSAFSFSSIVGITKHDLNLRGSGFRPPKWMNIVHPDELIGWLNAMREDTYHVVNVVA